MDAAAEVYQLLDSCHVLSLVSEHVLDPLPEDLALGQGFIGQSHGHFLETLEGLELQRFFLVILIILPHQKFQRVKGISKICV